MKDWKKALLYGFAVWLIPFAVAFLIFPIRQANRPLFESIMPVVLAGATAVMAAKYVKKAGKLTLREGAELGLLWFAVSVALDFAMFLPPTPWQMGVAEY